MMRFLGTGAAETLPNPFCDCPVCTGIRRDGSQHYKKRSCFQVNNQIMIDFGPDAIAAAHEYGLDFCALRHILFTHTHDDHLSFPNLSLLGMSQRVFDAPIELYFSPQAYSWVCQNVQAYNPDFIFSSQADGTAELRFSNRNAYRLNAIPCGTWLSIGNCQVKALRSSHPAWGNEEYAWNYLLQLPDGRKLFYACDTGRYLPETLQELENEAIDILIMECTFGSRRMEKNCGHLDVYSFLEMVQLFQEKSIIRPNTQIYSTHLNHKHTFTPLMLQSFFDQNSDVHITVARDGDIIL